MGVFKMINKKLLEEALSGEKKPQTPARRVIKENKTKTIERPVKEDMNLFMPALLVFYGATLLKMAHDFYKQNLSKYARQCSGLPEGEKSVCIVRAKRRAMLDQKSFLQKSLTKCKDAKDPSICNQKIQSKIKSTENEIEYLEDRLKRYGVSGKVM